VAYREPGISPSFSPLSDLLLFTHAQRRKVRREVDDGG
jgi:hypothetical protein